MCLENKISCEVCLTWFFLVLSRNLKVRFGWIFLILNCEVFRRQTYVCPSAAAVNFNHDLLTEPQREAKTKSAKDCSDPTEKNLSNDVSDIKGRRLIPPRRPLKPI